MSPLFSPGPRLALLPGQAAMAAGQQTRVEERTGEWVNDWASDWAGALQALQALLANGKASGRARVRLSHHFTRLFLLPAPATWLKPAEMVPWLRAQLDAPLSGAAGWDFTWRLAPPGQPILAAAMPSSHLAELTQILSRHGLGLGSVEPWLSAAWDKRRRKLGRASGWYALVEPGQLLLLRLLVGRIHGLRQRQLSADTATAAAELQALLTREALLAGLQAGGRVWLQRAGIDLDAAALASGYRLEQLSGPREAPAAMLA